MREPGKRIFRRRQQLRLTLEEVAARASLSRGTIVLAEKGRPIRPKNLEKIAEALECDMAYLKGEIDVPRIAETQPTYTPHPGLYLPLYNQIPVGTPLEITQYLDGECPVAPGQYKENRYILKVPGDCMCQSLCNGDLVLMEKTGASVGNGRIYAITLNGEKMLRRVYVKGKTIELKADNPIIPTVEVAEKDQFLIWAVFIEIVKGLR